MAGVTLTRSARTDLLEAWLYIAEEDLQAADRLLDKIENESLTLARQPLMGRACPTSTPYILFYLAQTSGITVLRVLHHARDVRMALFEGN
jgi:plasmid stabilization system protein ParE